MLQLANLKKFYHSHKVLDISSFQLENGIYWIKGANGSGKTTLLKIIAGLIPFDGDVSWNNVSLKKAPLLYRQNISWAEAEPLFPEFMSGIDLINLYRNIRKVSKEEAALLPEHFNMTGYINDPVGTYSAGMTKKLSLVLAFLGNPSLIMLDEPLITLDPDAFNSVCNYILDRHKNNGTCFLLSSHQEIEEQLKLSGKELTIKDQMIG